MLISWRIWTISYSWSYHWPYIFDRISIWRFSQPRTHHSYVVCMEELVCRACFVSGRPIVLEFHLSWVWQSIKKRKETWSKNVILISICVNVALGDVEVTLPSDANGAPHHHGPSIVNRLDATISSKHANCLVSLCFVESWHFDSYKFNIMQLRYRLEHITMAFPVSHPCIYCTTICNNSVGTQKHQISIRVLADVNTRTE